MIVSHRHRFIFVKTRKTAGTSVEIALSKHCGPDDVITTFEEADEAIRTNLGFRGPQNYEMPRQTSSWRSRLRAFAGRSHAPLILRHHDPATLIRDIVGGDIWDSYYTFAVERNPHSKAVSRYYWERARTARGDRGSRYAGLPIEEFLEHIPVRFLSDWPVYTDNDRVIVNRIIQFEQLQDGLDEVCAQIGLPPLSLPRAKSGNRPKQSHYSDVLNDRARERINLVCAKEIRYFGYRRYDPVAENKAGERVRSSR